MHYLLIYDVSPDYLERRGQFRKEHLALAWEASDRGELLLGGALADPVDSSVLLFQADSPATIERFGVRNLTPILGKAPEAWAGLAAPDAVFVGGTGRQVRRIHIEARRGTRADRQRFLQSAHFAGRSNELPGRLIALGQADAVAD